MYGRTPKAALVVDRSLRETGPGVFSIKTQVPAPGTYDVAFFLDSPRVVHCFNLTVRDNPALKRLSAKAVTVQPLLVSRTVRAGEPVELKFKLTDPGTGTAHENLSDVSVLVEPEAERRRFDEDVVEAGLGQRRGQRVDAGTGVAGDLALLPDARREKRAQRPVILQALGAEARKESP